MICVGEVARRLVNRCFSLSMSYTFCLLLLFSVLPAVIGRVMDPDYGVDTRRLITSRGFQCQEHDIVTQDGYILTVFRIVKERSRTKLSIIIVHGLFSSSRDFLIASPGGHVKEGTTTVGDNLGFELAKRDYDVWLVNSRGNTYSQNHTKYPTRERVNRDWRFWDFSHADMAQYDVPAVVDHVLRTTRRRTVGYIGHSRGTGAMFAALSMFPNLNNRIRPFIALSPVAFVEHASPLIFNFPVPAPLTGDHNFPVNQLDLVPDAIKKAGCSRANGIICTTILRLLGGDSVTMFNGSRIPVYLSRLPAGSSAKDIRLFNQNIQSGRFCRYDHGRDGNLEHYGSEIVPDYDLSRITNREIYLIRGVSDILCVQQDVDKLRTILKGRIREDIVIPVPGWGHMAMLYGKDMGVHVNTPILRILQRYR